MAKVEAAAYVVQERGATSAARRQPVAGASVTRSGDAVTSTSADAAANATPMEGDDADVGAEQNADMGDEDANLVEDAQIEQE
jgi:hypothetical protein